jgi:hypothetical protein
VDLSPGIDYSKTADTCAFNFNFDTSDEVKCIAILSFIDRVEDGSLTLIIPSYCCIGALKNGKNTISISIHSVKNDKIGIIGINDNVKISTMSSDDLGPDTARWNMRLKKAESMHFNDVIKWDDQKNGFILCDDKNSLVLLEIREYSDENDVCGKNIKLNINGASNF